MICPLCDDWVRLLDGEATHNEETTWRAHLAGCARCRAEHDRLGRLLADVAATVDGAPVKKAIEQVMQAVARGQTREEVARSRWPWVLGSTAFAAILTVLIWTYPPAGRFQPRGTAGAALSRRVDITLHGPPQALEPLDDGAYLTAATPLVAHWRSLERAPVYLLLFAVDARSDVHWLYPAYTDRVTDPAAVPLSHTVDERVMPESVLLEDPAQGPLRLISLVTREPLHVSAIERMAPAELRAERLQAHFPDASVTEVDVVLKVAP
jgi:hypothetical protein